MTVWVLTKEGWTRYWATWMDRMMGWFVLGEKIYDLDGHEMNEADIWK